MNQYSPKISLLYTSARPEKIHEVIARWYSSKHSTNFEMIITTDLDFEFKEFYHQPIFHINNGPRNCVTGWNLAAEKSKGEVLIQISDDLFPPEFWDLSIINLINDVMPENKYLALNLLDERRCFDAVYHPIITRECYLKTGYLYPPEFESMFCDNWFKLYHDKHNTLICSNEIFWNHQHRTTCPNATIDNITLIHESPERYLRGELLLNKYKLLHNLNS